MAKTKEVRYTTPRGRLSFPHLFKPRAQNEGGEEKFSLSLIFDADAQKTPEFAALKQAVKECVGQAFPKLAPKFAGVKNPFRDGAEKEYEGYGPGTLFISASSKYAPGVIGGDMKPIGEDECYAGCYVRATVTVFAYDNSGNKGVSFGLRNVQKLADGESLGGHADATDDFQAVPGYVAQPQSAAASDFGGGGAAPIADDDIPF